MAFREFSVHTSGMSAADFGVKMQSRLCYEGGIIEGNGYSYKIDWDYINDVLEENEDFTQALIDEGFEVNFNTFEPFELYRKLTGVSIKELFNEWHQSDNVAEIFQDAYNILHEQADETREYLKNNDKINMTYTKHLQRDELFVHCSFEADADSVREVGDKLNEINSKYTNKLRSLDEQYYICNDPKFGITLFRVKLDPDIEGSEFYIMEDL